MELSENLRKYRKYNSLTQAQLAEMLNIDRSTYSNYENGKRKPDIDTLIDLAKIYNVTIDTLVNGFSSTWDPLCDGSDESFDDETLLKLSDLTPAERRMVILSRLADNNELLSNAE